MGIPIKLFSVRLKLKLNVLPPSVFMVNKLPTCHLNPVCRVNADDARVLSLVPMSVRRRV